MIVPAMKSRRMWNVFAAITVSVLLLGTMFLAVASATARRPANLGVEEGRLRDCPASPNCVCSQASDAGHRLPPLPFSGSAAQALEQLQAIIQTFPRAKIVTAAGDYLHAEFTSRWFRFVDDVEFLVDAEQHVIHFRSASRAGYSDLGVNRARMQRIAQAFQERKAAPVAEPPRVSTFSIVAFDPEQREWGIGVASKFLAVGAVVPWAQAEAGAIATQSFANTTFGPRGLALLQQGLTPEEILSLLLAGDQKREERQVGIVDRLGRAAAFTGSGCHAWAGDKIGVNYTCQGNLLAGAEVLEAMAQAFEGARGPLAWRIMAALEAGEAQGGDVRGRQSAAILVVRDQKGYGGFNDRMIDFRVDDHPEPIPELARILSLRVPRPREPAAESK